MFSRSSSKFSCQYILYFETILLILSTLPFHTFPSPINLLWSPKQFCFCSHVKYMYMNLYTYMKSNIYKWEKTWYLSFWHWLNLLNMFMYSYINFPANDIISFFFWLKRKLHCVHIYFHYPSMDTQVGSITCLLWTVL